MGNGDNTWSRVLRIGPTCGQSPLLRARDPGQPSTLVGIFAFLFLEKEINKQKLNKSSVVLYYKI